MQDWKGRAVQDTERERLRSSGFGSVPAADQHDADTAARRDIDRAPHRALPASVQVETVPGKRAGQKNRRHKVRGARAARPTTSKRKAVMDAKVSSVQGRTIRNPIATTRRYDKRHKARDETGMGGFRVRGGASHPCPLCASATRVLRTTKISTTVQRHRQCLHCHHEYLTTERRL